MARPLRGRLRLAALALTAGAGLASACGNANLVGLGGECNLATDCEPGLVCVPQAGKRVCSNDLSGVQKPFQPGGADAGAGEGGGDGGEPAEGGPIPDATSQDTGTQKDTGVDAPPPSDGGAG